MWTRTISRPLLPLIPLLILSGAAVSQEMPPAVREEFLEMQTKAGIITDADARYISSAWTTLEARAKSVGLSITKFHNTEGESAGVDFSKKLTDGAAIAGSLKLHQDGVLAVTIRRDPIGPLQRKEVLDLLSTGCLVGSRDKEKLLAKWDATEGPEVTFSGQDPCKGK